ncbi:hypothetical protein ACHWQZ_G006663 [Mnemiopsis leidyi]
MAAFSKFFIGQCGSQQLLDTDGFTYIPAKTEQPLPPPPGDARRTEATSALASSTSTVRMNPSLPDLWSTSHNHHADALVEQKKNLIILSMQIAGTYPELMEIVNYFELTYLALAQPDGTRAIVQH